MRSLRSEDEDKVFFSELIWNGRSSSEGDIDLEYEGILEKLPGM